MAGSHPDEHTYRSTTLGADPETPGTARRWVVHTLEQWGWHGEADDVVTAVNELVTNAMAHAAGPIQVTMTCSSGNLWVDVHDEGVGRAIRQQVDPEATSGRGLQMVDSLSRSWGVITEPDGKHVWFEVSERQEPDSDPTPAAGSTDTASAGAEVSASETD